MNLTYVPTIAVVAVVVDGSIIGNFWFFPPPRQSGLVLALLNSVDNS